MKLSEELIEGLANIRRVVQEIVTTVEGRWALRFFLIPHKAPETAFVILYHEQVVDVLPICRFGHIFHLVPDLLIALP